MKTKHNVFVPVGSQQEAERMEKVLKAMGEKLEDYFWSKPNNFCKENYLYLYNDFKWVVWKNKPNKKKVTFGELIDILSKPDFYLYLEEAKQKYPKGTKFKQMTSKQHITSSGEFEIGEYGVTKAVYDKVNYNFVFKHNNEGVEWAEIVTEKIAVKVENEREFKALMNYYDETFGGVFLSQAYVPNSSGQTFIAFQKDYLQLEIKCNYGFTLDKYNFNGVTFHDFAKEHNIKVPLIISQDGVELFEGDSYHRVYFNSKKWIYNMYWNNLEEDNFIITDPDKFKAFSTKESALKWIEDQKPTSIGLTLDNGSKATVFDIGQVNFDKPRSFLLNSDIQAIAKAMEDLK